MRQATGNLENQSKGRKVDYFINWLLTYTMKLVKCGLLCIYILYEKISISARGKIGNRIIQAQRIKDII